MGIRGQQAFPSQRLLLSRRQLCPRSRNLFLLLLPRLCCQEETDVLLVPWELARTCRAFPAAARVGESSGSQPPSTFSCTGATFEFLVLAWSKINVPSLAGASHGGIWVPDGLRCSPRAI